MNKGGVKTKELQSARAALAELDEGKTTVFHRRVLLTSGLGFFTDAYDLFIIGIALSLIKTQWHPSTLAISLVSSTALIASAFGAIFFGRLADKLGRKKIYGLEVLLLAGGAIGTAFAPNIWWLIALRAVVGFGVGGDYPVSATIMSEYAGRKHRGRMVAMVFSMQAVGLIVGPLVAVALLESGMSHGLIWRIMLALGAVPALAVFRLRRQIHETPRFALAAGDIEHATHAARRASSATAVAYQPTALKIQNKEADSLSVFIHNKRLLRWLIGTASAWFLIDIAFYGNTISGPIVLKLLNPHASLVKTTLETLLIFVVAAAPGYLLAIRRIDTQGRKSIQSIGFLVMALSFAIIGLVPGIVTAIVPFLALYGISYFFTQYGPNTTTFVVPTELFPVRLRTTGHGISAA
ncbi:MAG TPA: MFS transporter, partial [Candidatus Dormibacteraeota bacterium]|nr:MFS transporter [Candidatus Dormibacteraeota bacterium]